VVGSAETEELIQPFKDDMEEFIWFCKISLDELQGNIADGKADFAEQVQYYRFRLKSPNTPPGAKDFFGVWAKFLAHFETVSLPVPCTYTLFCHFSLSFFFVRTGVYVLVLSSCAFSLDQRFGVCRSHVRSRTSCSTVTQPLSWDSDPFPVRFDGVSLHQRRGRISSGQLLEASWKKRRQQNGR
jgi:hypothetical protein